MNGTEINDHPFFSIIIPVYNAGEYLRECLLSILGQTFADWEVVMVDDCSTDDSVAVAREFVDSDARMRLHTSECNSGGAYSPRMRAARSARGRFLVIIDADDFVSADLLQCHFDAISATGAKLVIPEMWKYAEGEGHKILPADTIDVAKVWEGRELIPHTLCRWEIPMAGFAVDPRVYLDADARVTHSDRKSIFADELLSRHILSLCGRVAFDAGRYFYRYNEVSVTHANPMTFIKGKMLTCDSLLSLTRELFGEGSEGHLKAVENKFLSAVDLLRMVNQSHLSPSDRREAQRVVGEGVREIDFRLLEGRVSPRYLALMRLPVSLSLLSLRVIDPIMQKYRRK